MLARSIVICLFKQEDTFLKIFQHYLNADDINLINKNRPKKNCTQI